MINSSDFIKRLHKIIDFHNLSASAFADKIGVQRSSISHILSERNKPSLEFIMKILSSFPDVDLYWLLNGKGNFPSEIKKDSVNENKELDADVLVQSKSNQSEIDRIIIFFKDGSFKNYKN